MKTLAHEMAHAILHEGYRIVRLAELEAESIAYVVCAALGINSEDYSFGYVAQRGRAVATKPSPPSRRHAIASRRPQQRILRSFEEDEEAVA